MSMADTFQFELVSPERQLVSATITEAIIPGQEGDLAAMAHHAPLIAQLRPGILTIPSLNGSRARFYLRGGVADVGPDITVVLAEYAVPLPEFSTQLYEEELAAAQKAYDEAVDDEARFDAQDKLERLQSLKDLLSEVA